MKLQYLLIDRKAASRPYPSYRYAGVSAKKPVESGFKSAQLDDAELAEVQKEQKQDAVLSMRFQLIKPVSTRARTKALDDGPEAWGIAAVNASRCVSKGSGVKVAVLDTGIDPEHPAFLPTAKGQGVKLTLVDFTHNIDGEVGKAPDTDGHGTHCAATIFGSDVGGVRIGVAPEISEAFILKVLEGGPFSGTTEAIYSAVQWAARHGADVISMSLGFSFPEMVEELQSRIGGNFPQNIAVSIALKAYRENVRLFDRLADSVFATSNVPLLVAATGNASSRERNPLYKMRAEPPASAQGFLPVTAVGRTREEKAAFYVAEFANADAQLAGPGVDVRSAQLTRLGGGLCSLSGTSMATPHVAGVAALWIEHLFGDKRPPDWSDTVMEHMKTSAKDVGLEREDVGSGLVQAPPKSEPRAARQRKTLKKKPGRLR